MKEPFIENKKCNGYDMKIKETISVACIVLMLLCPGLMQGQSSQNKAADQQALYREIAHMDSVLFNAFNKRDVEKFKSLFTDDLEFYHDLGGLTGYKHTVDFMISTASGNSDLRRDLVEGSLEVYPVKDYGAIQIGQHRFCHTENGKQDCGTFKFVQIWQKKNGEWKISRVVSYGH
jgi:hypothetical protein